MNGVIWYKYPGCLKEGEKQLQRIKNNYLTLGIDIQKEYRDLHGCWVEFNNGDIWRVVPASDRMRGIRANIHYIHRKIPIEVVNCIIKSCMTSMPFSGMNFYGDGELYLTDKEVTDYPF